jgi:beta-lactamase class A
MSKKILFLGSVFLLAVGVFLGYFLFNKNDSKETSNTENHNNFPLLARRIFIENPNDTRVNFSPLRNSLRQYFTDNSLEGSLYFEYLPTGTSIRINGNEEYRAASLMKLPVAMEVYKAQELGLLSLQDKITLKEEWLNDGFGELYEKGAGYELTLGEIVEILIKESDNTALRAAIASTDNLLPLENRALGSLDIEFSIDSSGAIDIGTRSYSSFLKCLYFACYNNISDSQQLLELLTETEFKDRIVAGVENTPVAHKIGVFNTTIQGDCGIVYKTNNPFVICIILEKNDSPETNKHFENLSRLTFNYLNQ